jgi:hypothetical protein
VYGRGSGHLRGGWAGAQAVGGRRDVADEIRRCLGVVRVRSGAVAIMTAARRWFAVPGDLKLGSNMRGWS